MVNVRPVQSDKQVSELFIQHGIKQCDGGMAMVAIENERQVGSAVFQLINGELTLLSVEYPEKDYTLCDLISRGVMNYGVNRGVLYCQLGEKAPKAEFLMLGFIKDMSECSVNIIRTFTMCTHCKSNKNNQ